MSVGRHGLAPACAEEFRSVLSFLPLILGSVLIVLLATTAGPASTHCLFQSPVSPIETLPVESPVVASPEVSPPAVASPTCTAPAMRAVPTTPNFAPWIAGVLIVVIVVGAVLYWRSRREGEEGNA